MRYIVFMYDSYYPRGGAHDIKLVTDSRDEAYYTWLAAKKHGHPRYHDYVEVYDVREQRIIF